MGLTISKQEQNPVPPAAIICYNSNGTSNNLKDGISFVDKTCKNSPFPQVFYADFLKHKHEATMVTLANEICPITRNKCYLRFL
jgi:hypothetical protein